jgi:hypothetical protein
MRFADFAPVGTNHSAPSEKTSETESFSICVTLKDNKYKILRGQRMIWEWNYSWRYSTFLQNSDIHLQIHTPSQPIIPTSTLPFANKSGLVTQSGEINPFAVLLETDRGAWQVCVFSPKLKKLLQFFPAGTSVCTLRIFCFPLHFTNTRAPARYWLCMYGLCEQTDKNMYTGAVWLNSYQQQLCRTWCSARRFLTGVPSHTLMPRICLGTPREFQDIWYSQIKSV